MEFLIINHKKIFVCRAVVHKINNIDHVIVVLGINQEVNRRQFGIFPGSAKANLIILQPVIDFDRQKLVGNAQVVIGGKRRCINRFKIVEIAQNKFLHPLFQQAGRRRFAIILGDFFIQQPLQPAIIAIRELRQPELDIAGNGSIVFRPGGDGKQKNGKQRGKEL